MLDKSFFEIFKRYQPIGARRAILEEARGIAALRLLQNEAHPEKIDRVEVDLCFDRRQDYETLYAIEDEMCTLYEARSFRIFPKYPPELFSIAAMPEILAEAERIGAVTHGFFLQPSFSLVGDDLAVLLPFSTAGIDLLTLSRTDAILGRIIESRYGRTLRVHIESSPDAIAQEEERRLAQEAYMQEIDRRIREQAAATRASAKESTPTVEDEHADFARMCSVMPACEAPEKLSEDALRVGRYTFLIKDAETVFGSSFPIVEPTPMSELREGHGMLFLGKIFEATMEENRTGDRMRIRIGFSDGSSSMYIRTNQPVGESGWAKALSVGKCIAALGRVTRDRFDGELILQPRHIMKIGVEERQDTAPEKRVELHLHTNMSAMDALITPKELVRTATAWGHSAIAVTDHGNVQAFPEVMLELLKQKSDLKVIYGMEAYYVNDTARVIYGQDRPDFDGSMVVFDIETTGLSPVNCHITEIGAVRISGGEVTETFQTFVDPETPIPEEIVRLTSITDEMVKGAPKVKEALESFFAFVGQDMLIAHNANFDTGFIRAYAEKCGLVFPNTYLDTLALSRYVNADLKNHKLDTIANAYHLGEFNHHRANDDAYMLAMIFLAMIARLRSEGIHDFDALVSAMSESADPLKLKPMHMILLARDLVGLKNLYRLISESYLSYYKRFPRIPKSLLEQYREGLIVGSACEAGELFSAILEGKPQGELEEIASFYDYLEIQPLCNNRFLIANGTVSGDEQLMELNRRIVSLGEKLGKPVVATCDAHFLNPEDEIFRKILLAGMKFSDADKESRRPSGLRKTIRKTNFLAHRTTWLRSDFIRRGTSMTDS